MRWPNGQEEEPELDDRKKMLAQRLKSAREQASRARREKGRAPATQAWVAKRLGYSQSFISKLEAGKEVPNFLDLERLANLYGVKLDRWTTYTDRQRNAMHYNGYL